MAVADPLSLHVMGCEKQTGILYGATRKHIVARVNPPRLTDKRAYLDVRYRPRIGTGLHVNRIRVEQ